MIATALTLFKANTKEITKEVARPKVAPPLLWWRPQAATFVMVFDGVNIVAVNAVLVLQVGKSVRRTVGRMPLRLHVPSRCDTTMDDRDTTGLQFCSGFRCGGYG